MSREARSMSMYEFEMAMAEKGTPITRIKIIGDGHCMFRAVSAVVYGHEDEHQRLRAAVVKYLVSFCTILDNEMH